MMAHSENAPTEILESSKEAEIDLEDGEIEDDEDEETPIVEKTPSKLPPPKVQAPIIEPPSKTVSSPLLSSSKKKRPPKITNNKSVLNIRNHEISAVQDDWADNVEKAIRAAMGAGDQDDGDENGEVGDTKNSGDGPCDDDKKSRRKKRKKKHRDDEGDDRKDAKKRRRHRHPNDDADDYDGEDDDEMMFVRGASPILRDAVISTQSPQPAYQDDPFPYGEGIGQFDENYDSFDEESDMDDYHMDQVDGGSPRSRGGRGMKRRGRGAIRGIGGRKLIRGRENLKKRKRLVQQQMRHGGGEQRQGVSDGVCMFYMQGKCQKGDECPYSHDVMPPRKMELCKFYLMDCCAKKDKCLYMHHDFPCKFFHTGLKCYAAERCKFSHGQLNDVTKAILLRHLETAPKEILGDFPRLSRESAAQMVNNKSKRDFPTTSPAAGATGNGKSIPSLLDLEVSKPAMLHNRDDEAASNVRTTPMPSDNEDTDINKPEESPSPSKEENRLSSKRHKNRWDNGEETNKQPRHIHDENKQRWDEEIRKQQQQQQQQQQKQQQEGNKVQHDEQQGEADNKRKRRSEKEKEKKQRREEKQESHNRRRELREEEKKKRDKDKQIAKEKSAMFGGHSEFLRDDVDLREKKPSYKDQDFNEQLDQLKPMMQHRKEVVEDNQNQSKRLLQLAGYSNSPPFQDIDDRLLPTMSEADDNDDDKEDLVMDIDERDLTNRKQSLDELALIIDTPEEDEEREREIKVTRESEDGQGRDAFKKLTDQVIDENAVEEAPIPSHLPKKQQELFLRIQQQQQQQREQEINKERDSVESKDEDQNNEENWYSSDEEDNEQEEPSLSLVLKNLKTSKKLDEASVEFQKKVTDLTKVPDVSDAVNKLLSTIGIRHQTEEKKERDTSTSSDVQKPVVRDPRIGVVSRDPRKRPSNETQASSHSPMYDPSSSSRLEPKAQPSTSTAPSIYSTIVLPVDIDSRPNQADSQKLTNDVDLRVLLNPNRDVDLRASSKDMDLRQQTYGDMDLRTRPRDAQVNSLVSPLAPHLLNTKLDMEGSGDVDLRRMFGDLPFKPAPLHAAATEIDASFNSHSMIPYKVVTVLIPTPDYSRLKLSSTEPLVRSDPRLRKLFKMTLSSPLSPSITSPIAKSANPTSRADPRRLANQSRSNNADNQDSMYDDYLQPQQHSDMMNDPYSRQQHALNQQMLPGNSPMLNFDPRVVRSGPNTVGLLGAVPLPLLNNFHPPMSRFEEIEQNNSNGSDTDLRMFYQQGNKGLGNSIEMQDWEQQQMQQMQLQQEMLEQQQIQQQQQHNIHGAGHRNNNRWRDNIRSNRRNRSNNRNNNRSYTPPN